MKNIEQARKYEGKHVVSQVEVTDKKDIGAQQAAVKQDGKIEKEGDLIPVLKGFPAYHVCGHGGEEKARESSNGGNVNGDPVSLHQTHGVLEDHFVGVKVKAPGQKTVAACTYGHIRRERARYQQHKGHEAAHGDDGDQGIANYVKQNGGFG